MMARPRDITVLVSILSMFAAALPALRPHESAGSGLSGSSGRALDAVLDCGAPTDGATDAAPAINACLSRSASVLVPAAAGGASITYSLKSAIKIPSGAHLFCASPTAVTLRAINPNVPTVLNLARTSGVEFDNCGIDGSQRIMKAFQVAPGVIVANATSGANLHDLVINNPLEGPVFASNSHSNTLARITVYNSAHHGFLFVDGYENCCKDCGGNGGHDFMIWATGKEHNLWLIHPWSNYNGIELVGTEPNTYNVHIIAPVLSQASTPWWAASTAYRAGAQAIANFNVYAASTSGMSGLSGPSGTGSVSDGGVTWTYVRPWITSGDNCISIVGSSSSVVGGSLTSCLRAGIGVYGHHNTVTGVKISNIGQLRNHSGPRPDAQYAGIENNSAFGGFNFNNVEVRNIIDDNQATPTTYYGIEILPGYASWTSGGTYRPNTWVISGPRIYFTRSGGTAGWLPPSCPSGTCSDGAIAWTYIEAFTGQTQPHDDVVSPNAIASTMIGGEVREVPNR